MDNKVDKQCLRLLRYAPVPMLMNAYWALGNRQMFFNEYTFRKIAYGEIQNPGHDLFTKEYFKPGDSGVALHLIPILLTLFGVIF